MLFPKPFPMEGADPPGSPPAAPPAPAADPPPTDPPPAPLPPDVAAKELEQARKDAAGYREKLRKAEADLAERAKQDEERQKSALAEQGKFKELYEGEKKRAEDLAGRVSSYEATFKAQADAELATVPEQYRDLIPAGTQAQQLEWVRNAKAKGLFGPAPAPPSAPKPPTIPPTAPAPPAAPADGVLSEAEFIRLSQASNDFRLPPAERQKAKDAVTKHIEARRAQAR